MLAASGKRRNLVIAILVVFLLVAFYCQLYLDTESSVGVIPQDSISNSSFISSSSSSSSSSSTLNSTSTSNLETPSVKTSHLHYLIPASLPNLHFCYNLVSSAVNRYPVPTLLGWHGVDELDAAKTHLAKIRVLERYLNSLSPGEDDDLVIIVDGYDILLQLPPDIMVERYFEVAARADARLAERLAIGVEELHSRGLRQTIFWGPDKVCWPIDPRAPRCWAAPESPIPPAAWGRPNKGDNGMFYSDPRWLNSGTVIAPIGDMRRYVAATMEEIRATHDPDYEFRESDQYYLASVWGRQEYWRSKMVTDGGPVLGGPPDRIIPEKRSEDQQTEYHIAIEYESSLFQTRAGYQTYFGYLQFNNSDLSANMTVDILQDGPAFRPVNIKMPENVKSALSKLYDAIPEAHPGSTARDWIRTVNLGVNYVTHHIYALWHCTGPKEFVGLEYPTLWFYPFVKSLLKAAVKASQSGELVSPKFIDGRQWAPKMRYPGSEIAKDEFGGAWTDLNGGEFVPWKALCGEHEELLFKGEHALADLPADQEIGLVQP